MAKKPRRPTKPKQLVKEHQRKKDHKISCQCVSHQEARADKNPRLISDLDTDSGYDTDDPNEDIIEPQYLAQNFSQYIYCLTL